MALTQVEELSVSFQTFVPRRRASSQRYDGDEVFRIDRIGVRVLPEEPFLFSIAAAANSQQ